jgi:hypothetical protein
MTKSPATQPLVLLSRPEHLLLLKSILYSFVNIMLLSGANLYFWNMSVGPIRLALAIVYLRMGPYFSGVLDNRDDDSSIMRF